MRNKYPGICYRCGNMVEKGDGHFERHNGKWRTQHADCAIKHKEAKINHTKSNAESNASAIADSVHSLVGQCQHFDGANEACERRATHGSRYCNEHKWLHGPYRKV